MGRRTSGRTDGLPGGGLELAVMQVLWKRREATVTQVHEALARGRDLAPTTVATTLRRLEQKGLASHRTQGRQYVYRPAIAQQEVRRSVVRDLTERLFGGDPAALVHHLISERDLEPGDLERIRALLRRPRERRPSDAR